MRARPAAEAHVRPLLDSDGHVIAGSDTPRHGSLSFQRTECLRQAVQKVFPFAVDALSQQILAPFRGTKSSVSGEPADFADAKAPIYQVP